MMILFFGSWLFPSNGFMYVDCLKIESYYFVVLEFFQLSLTSRLFRLRRKV